jgi:prepilin-type N-terminal cleavage/methylation domain-containing protein
MDLKKAVTLNIATSSDHCLKEKQCGFSLIEMLVVLSIVSLLSILVTAGLQSVLGNVLDGQVSDLASTLARARAYAMANNTYVFVGIQEVSAANPASGTQTTGTGRVAVTVMASSDGTRGYPISISTGTALTSLNVVMPLHHYDNLHLLTSAGTGIANLPNTSTSGLTSNAASSTSLTTFTWPLGSSSPQYPAFGSNGTVIQYNPLGQAQIVTGPFTDAVLQWIEIDLSPTHGTTVSGKNPATILIDGASGSVTTYRE